MPRQRTRKQRLSAIEILSSSDNESQSSKNTQEPAKATKTPAEPNPSPAPSDDDDVNDESSTKSSKSEYRILTRRKYVEQLPVASRTKRANKEVASMRLLSLDMYDGKTAGLSMRSQENMEKLSRIESKKKTSLKDDIQKVVQADMDDPELTQLLKKIAYCRVFTNYLFRQYDMLSIDFKLYSNLDDLMMNLKRRVGAYNAIRRSRLQILLGEGGGSSSSREGSTA